MQKKAKAYDVHSSQLINNKDKEVFIFGGGDSALDWTVELSKVASHVSLVHRRDQFRGAFKTEQEMRELVKKEKVSKSNRNDKL